MTYNTDAEADTQTQEEIAMAIEFLKACRKCDANALAAFAPRVTDWDAVKRQPRAAGSPIPKRVQTLAEVLDESLNYGSGPTKTELMQLLLSVAFGFDTVNAPAQARSLLGHMASTFATNNAGI